ncbi:MAG: hypothetical protein M3Z27_02665 [Actinomycetota bacterium]|nr:hypothetical protein [Actinomycetota bacterium]
MQMPPAAVKVQIRRRLRIAVSWLLVAAATISLSACGGSGDAKQLLQQTFSGAHSIRSGNLSFSLTLTPSGSSTFTAPVTISFGGPFQSLGAGKLPASNFNLSMSGFGRGGSVGILSTGTTGYVTLQGTSYQLPSGTFQKLESSFAGVTSAGGSGHSSGGLSKLGIDPLRWLTTPAIVGSDSVGGTSTTHIRAAINVKALLVDLNTFLQKASSAGAPGTAALSRGLPPSTQDRIATEVQGPTFDVWTGKADKTLRRLALKLTVPVTGQTSTLLGGLRTAGIAIDMRYTSLGQPQTITPPTAVRPFGEFQTKLRSFLSSVGTAGAAALAPGLGAGGSTTSTAPAAPSGSGSGSSVQAYSKCLQAAGTDVTKMQSCASLLSGK